MTPELKQFIIENKDLINKNTKESWEEIYKKTHQYLKGEFTEAILNAKINDPAMLLGYIPNDYLYNSDIINYKIPNNITTIGYSAFAHCTSLTSVEIGDGVTTIGTYAFLGCSSLTSVEIPDSVTTICDGAFRNCTNLTEIIYKGTKKDALIKLKVKNKKWRQGSTIKKIICIDGVIEL